MIDLIKRKGLEESVHLLGFKNHLELKTLLADSCAMLINTYQDNNMVSIPESISCGTPVITNTIPTNSTYIGENHLGITKDEWNEDELKKVVDENQYYVNNCIKFRKS
ncbi:glycosyltransferase [Bacteroides ovatus]|nr:glycosyltransferase [Bacteroides ovatus]